MSAPWIAIALVGAGTFAIRSSFLLAADRAASVSGTTERVLRMIPPAALSAIACLALADPDGSTGLVARCLAAVAAVAVTRRWSNLAVPLGVGMAVVMAVDALA